MARTREDLISNIRACLPYMDTRDLRYVVSFIHGLGCDGFSDAEWVREVLPQEKQRQRDFAYRCMTLIVEDRKGDLQTGDPIVIQAPEVARIWHDAGMIRVKRADLIQWMEDAGYITSRRKGTTEAGKRVEMLYISVEKFNQVRAAEENARASLGNL